jgi:hypothetical protein
MEAPYSLDAHIQIAVRNAIVLIVVTFIVGGLVGWAIGQWPRAPIGASVGAATGVGFLLWFCRMYYVTRGLLQTTGIGRSG